MRRKTGFTLIAIFGVPLVFFSALEGLLYLCGVPRFVRTPDGNQITSFQECRFGKSELDRCAPVDTGTKQAVLVYGESTVEGSRLSKEQRFTAVLQRGLDLKAPGLYQVINYGVSCKDSYFIAECARLSIHGRPAAVVLYAGHNDFTNQFNPKSLATPLRNSAWLPPLLVYVRRFSRIYSVMASAVLRIRGAQTYPFTSREQYQARHHSVTEAFLVRVDEIRRSAEASGAQFVLFTPGSNLQFRTDERNLKSPLFHTLKTESWDLLAKANQLLSGGKWQESLPVYRAARDGDPVPSRATSAFNQSLRAYAQEHPEIRLVDFERVLDSRFGSVGIGCNLFGDSTYCDQMHPNAQTHELIAELLLAELLRRETSHTL